ncbi:MAG: hypothetical protein NTW19_22860 [Planctomycetota bacterium]|nr:hypothetical protein [Planctomycetota bacterium]
MTPATPPGPPPESPQENPPESSPPSPAAGGPDYRDLYILIAGLCLGLLLCPGILGRLAPETYERWFVGGSRQRQALALVEKEAEEGRQALAQVGASPMALTEFEQKERPKLALMQAEFQQAQADHLTRLNGMLASLTLALAAVMVLESLVDPSAQHVRSRLTSGRYVVLGLWAALALARPALLRSASPVVVALAVAAVVLLLLLPGPSPWTARNPRKDVP